MQKGLSENDEFLVQEIGQDFMSIFSDMGWRTVRRMILLLVCFQALCACGKNEIPVNIHGVNYHDSAFSYVLSDPGNTANRAGGELIEPFSAGGIMCCYLLPKKWRRGLQVSVKWTYWQKKPNSADLDEVKKTVVLDIPSYVDGKPAELWILRGETGSLTLVGSDVQPDHPSWPGKIKGWPIPSLDFQRERWALYVKLAQGNVDLYQRYLEKLHAAPTETAKEIWASDSQYSPAELKGYVGYSDPKYLAHLETEFRDSLAHSKRVLEQEIARRP